MRLKKKVKFAILRRFKVSQLDKKRGVILDQEIKISGAKKVDISYITKEELSSIISKAEKFLIS